ncbi:MAG: hypothetical protein ACOYVD_16875 [Bacillota bacterium]
MTGKGKEKEVLRCARLLITIKDSANARLDVKVNYSVEKMDNS